MFVIRSTENMLKFYTPGWLTSGCDTIILIINIADWGLICKRNKTHIINDNTCRNNKRVYYDYKVGNILIINEKSA